MRGGLTGAAVRIPAMMRVEQVVVDVAAALVVLVMLWRSRDRLLGPLRDRLLGPLRDRVPRGAYPALGRVPGLCRSAVIVMVAYAAPLGVIWVLLALANAILPGAWLLALPAAELAAILLLLAWAWGAFRHRRDQPRPAIWRPRVGAAIAVYALVVQPFLFLGLLALAIASIASAP